MKVEATEGSMRAMGVRMLSEEEVHQIKVLHRLGWGTKQISRELGFARNTVRAWIREGETRGRVKSRRVGLLAEHAMWLESRFQAGVRNGDVLRQELAEMGISVSLRTVERALRPLRLAWVRSQASTVRFETPPGKQLQIDMGEKWLQIGGVRQKRYVFVATLGYSRRCYVEVFGSLRQRDWIMGIERAFQHFCGVPEQLLCDNAKPLVDHRKEGQPVFHPEFEAFCRHWGTIPKACKPYRARTKGKVERGVSYVKSNALGRLEWDSDEALDEHLIGWMKNIADVRIHGTTHERPIDRFQAEHAALRPIGKHPSYLRIRRITRKVRADGRIDVDTNHYSVPPEFIGEKLDVLIEADTLWVMFQKRVLAEHSLHPGRYQVIEDPAHVIRFRKSEAFPEKPVKRVGEGIQRPLSHYAAIAGGERW